MKGKKHLLIGLVFGSIIGWVFGFLRFPYLEKNTSFLLGFVASLVFVSLLFMILQGLFANKVEVGDAKSTPKPTLIWRILIGVVVLGSLLSSLIIYRQNNAFKLQIQNHESEMQKMKAVVELAQKTNQEPLISSILKEIGEELKRNPKRTLTNATISRIVALSVSLKSYPSIEKDSLSKKRYSKERGQLLQALALMNMDTSSFGQIKRLAVFEEADLRGADLKGADLNGVNLKKAHFKDADLSGAILRGANLDEANFWGANLNKANLSHADLQLADLTWARLNEATLVSANMNGAIFQNAQLIKADLNQASFQWAQSGGALLNEAKLTNVDLIGNDFRKANLSQADLSGSKLRSIILTGATLTGAQFDSTIVDVNWMELLDRWQPIGGKELFKNYTVVVGGVDKFKNPVYQLKKN